MSAAENVFINCPFDDEYQPLFRALVFAVQDCGFVARSALERDDGSEGHDIRAHRCEESEVVRAVRNAVRTWRPDRRLPGARMMFERYSRFLESLPRLASIVSLDVDELTFNDLSFLIDEWLRSNRPLSAN